VYISDKDKLFVSKLDDAVYLSQKRQKPYFFSFLSEAEQALAKKYLESIGFDSFGFYGGYENS
jgi:hypothetical protein